LWTTEVALAHRPNSHFAPFFRYFVPVKVVVVGKTGEFDEVEPDGAPDGKPYEVIDVYLPQFMGNQIKIWDIQTADGHAHWIHKAGGQSKRCHVSRNAFDYFFPKPGKCGQVYYLPSRRELRSEPSACARRAKYREHAVIPGSNRRLTTSSGDESVLSCDGFSHIPRLVSNDADASPTELPVR
jgi:hypothetical protein